MINVQVPELKAHHLESQDLWKERNFYKGVNKRCGNDGRVSTCEVFVNDTSTEQVNRQLCQKRNQQ